MNFRKHARNTGTTSTSTSDPNSGYEQRLEILADLPYFEREIALKDKSNDHSLIDGYMVFEVEIPPKSHQIAIENDFTPRMVAKKILSLERAPHDGPSIFLPYIPIYKFMSTYPNFLTTFTATARYINYDIKNGQTDRKTWKKGPYNSVMSSYDFIEVYAQLLNGTLIEYFKDATSNKAKMVWRVMRSFETLIEKLMNETKVPSSSTFEEYILDLVSRNYDKTVKYALERDTSLEAAKQFKKHVQQLSPFAYFYIMFQAMIMDHTVMHKSNFIQADMLLAGLFLMKKLGEQGVSLAGIEESYLRILYERAINLFTPTNFANLFELDEFIKHLHEEIGKKFHHYLKINAFSVEVYRQLFLNNNVEWTGNRFVKCLDIVHSHITSTSGITTLSHIIAPSAENYISDESVAEFIATAASASSLSKKHASLSTRMFSSSIDLLPTINQILKKNVDRLTYSMESMKLIENTVKQALEESAVLDLLNGYRYSKGVHIGDSSKAIAFKRILVEYIKGDHVRAPIALSYLIDQTAKERAQILGVRNILGSIAYFRKRGGNIENWFHTTFPNYKYSNGRNILKNDKDVKNAERYTLNDIARIQQAYANNIDMKAEKVEKFTFEKFTSIRSELYKKVQRFKDELASKSEECPICMEQRLEMIWLHGDYKHSICTLCHHKLEKKVCPFCRRIL